MNATVDRTNVKEALTVIGRHVSTRYVTLPSLAGVRIETVAGRMTLAATDLETTVTVTIDATDTTDGVALVPLKALTSVVKNGNATVGIGHGDEPGTVYVGSVQLRTLELADYPTLRTVGDSVGSLTVSDIETIGTVARFASTDDGRPVLTGGYFSGCEVAATDSYRLSVGDLSTDVLDGALVPARTLVRLARLKTDGPVTVARDSDTVTFRATTVAGPKRSPRVSDVTVTVRTIEGTFPNYPMLMPEPANVDMSAVLVTVDRDRALAALATVAPLAGARDVPVYVSIVGETVTFTVTNRELGTGSASTMARVQGPGWTLAPFGQTFETNYNPTFLADQLRAYPAGPVAITLRDTLKPARFDHVDSGTVGLLMPMRVS